MSPKPRLNLCNKPAKPDNVAELGATLRDVLGRSPAPGTSPEILIVADDYVTKPFGMKELVARINANLKRSGIPPGARAKVIEVGDLWLDTKNFTARLRGEPLSLRLKEFEILSALASRPGELKSREDLAKEVWGHAGVGASRTIDVHIRRLRATLEGKSDYDYIQTVRGLGYRFEAQPKGTGDGEVSSAVEREIADPRE